MSMKRKIIYSTYTKGREHNCSTIPNDGKVGQGVNLFLINDSNLLFEV